MPLSFAQANIILFLTQFGFAGLNVAQVYAIVDIGNEQLAFQFFKTCLGSLLFLFLLILTDRDRILEQAKQTFTKQFAGTFLICCVCLAVFEVSLIITLTDLGATMVSIGISCTGGVAYILNLVLGIEKVLSKKLIGSLLTVGGACLAVKVTWFSSDQKDRGVGVIAMVLMIFSMVGYYMFQKKLYPDYTVTFVTTFTLLTACLFMFIGCLIYGTLTIHWSDSQTWYCLIYSGFIGQFLLYIASNSANVVLTAPMICLYQGIQPIVTPWLDMIRLCEFPRANGEFENCETPPNGILLAAFMVAIGLGVYGWGESDSMKRQQNLKAAEKYSNLIEEQKQASSNPPHTTTDVAAGPDGYLFTPNDNAGDLSRKSQDSREENLMSTPTSIKRSAFTV